MSTLRDRKSATKPRPIKRASSSHTAAISASRPARATYCEEPVAAIPAAVAESAPTTRWRDEPSNAKTKTGSTIVYRPVITGIPAMLVYPITSGMANAASVTPAITSTGISARSIDNRPSRTGSRPVRRVPFAMSVSLWASFDCVPVTPTHAAAVTGMSLRAAPHGVIPPAR